MTIENITNPNQPLAAGDQYRDINDNGTFTVGTYGDGKPEVVQERLIAIKDILQTLPLGTKRKLEAIRSSADYTIPADAGNGDTADLLLTIIQSGDAINVNSPAFDNLMQWILAQTTLDVTQAHIDAIKAG